MNMDTNFLNLILLAAAVVIGWKLWSVLGQRTGHERPSLEIPRSSKPEPAAKTLPLDPDATAVIKEPVWKGHAPEDSTTARTLEAIAGKSPAFSVDSFLSGASSAYEWILEAYAKGDKQSLKTLLSKDVLRGFADAIDERARSKKSVTFRFVGMKSAGLESAELSGNRATLGVSFVGQVISATRDAQGQVIEGDEKAIRELRDTWLFERDLTSRDPNWILVSTGENGG